MLARGTPEEKAIITMANLEVMRLPTADMYLGRRTKMPDGLLLPSSEDTARLDAELLERLQARHIALRQAEKERQ